MMPLLEPLAEAWEAEWQPVGTGALAGVSLSVVAMFAWDILHIFQGNMTDVAELQRALETPGAYHHLMVRVGGFSARFVNLSRELQVEIIERHRHAQ